MNKKFYTDDINISNLIINIWNKKGFIGKSTLFFLLFGVFIAFISPKKYTSSTSFIPQLGNENSSNEISGLASLAGINLDNNKSSEISPILYPKILKSYPFKKEIIKSKLIVNNDTISYEKYLENQDINIMEFLKRIPYVIINLFKNENKNKIILSDNSLIVIPKKQDDIFKKIDDQINVSVNEKEGLITLNVVLDNPLNSAIIANDAVKLLQNSVIDLKIKHAKEQLFNIQKQFKTKKNELINIQNQLANFKDQNKNISSSMFDNKLKIIEAEFNIINNVYQQLANQLEDAKIKVNKDTPVFSIIQPVVVPNERSSPKRLIIITYWLLFGIIISIIASLQIKNFQELKTKILKQG